ncbi:hypothetical protein S245_056742, partial [Arachis hypogaea]
SEKTVTWDFPYLNVGLKQISLKEKQKQKELGHTKDWAGNVCMGLEGCSSGVGRSPSANGPDPDREKRAQQQSLAILNAQQGSPLDGARGLKREDATCLGADQEGSRLPSAAGRWCKAVICVDGDRTRSGSRVRATKSGEAEVDDDGAVSSGMGAVDKVRAEATASLMRVEEDGDGHEVMEEGEVSVAEGVAGVRDTCGIGKERGDEDGQSLEEQLLENKKTLELALESGAVL